MKSSGGSLNAPQPLPLPMHCCYLQKPPEFPQPSHPLGASEPQQLTKKIVKTISSKVARGNTLSCLPRSTVLWWVCPSTENAWSQVRTKKQKLPDKSHRPQAATRSYGNLGSEAYLLWICFLVCKTHSLNQNLKLQTGGQQAKLIIRMDFA